ncbi:MAG: hypothetical protein IKY83_03875 [Proteobacteria bacterium]|nr:hypothetical protein [Pseudomonadota bacterium]
MPGCKAEADGHALTCVTETDKAADADAQLSERKKKESRGQVTYPL